MPFSQVLRNLNWSYLTDLLLSVIPALVCITIHEMCHGFAAYLLGDTTAKAQGRLSPNPLRHLDPMGLLMLVIFHFGWAKPVSVDMRRFRKPKRDMAITALAGPASNIVLACVLLFLRGLLSRWLLRGGVGRQVLELLDLTAYLSVCLGIFNLLPIPPLDGSKVLFSLLPERLYFRLMYYERYGMVFLLLLMLSGVVNGPLGRVSYFIFDHLFEIARAGYKLINLLA